MLKKIILLTFIIINTIQAQNVGIGTNSPIDKLHIDGNVRVGLINPTNTGTFPAYGNRLYLSGGPAGATWNSENSDPIWLARYNSAGDQTELRMNLGDNVHSADKLNIGYTYSVFNSVMVVQANTRVGIGTENPINILHIKTPSNPYYVLENATSSFGFGMPNALDKLYIWSYTASASMMTILANGNIGIGENNPTDKLVVNGSIKIADGTQGAGKVLVSDANGKANWQNGLVKEASNGSYKQMCSGKASGTWVKYSPHSGVYIDVNTSGCGFSTTPRYITSVQGGGNKWNLTGTSSVYSATATGFRVYLRYDNDATNITAAYANTNWQINWIAIEE